MLKKLRRKSKTNDLHHAGQAAHGPAAALMDEESFLRALHVEQKRTERSRRPFVLALLEPVGPGGGSTLNGAFTRAVEALGVTKRETDQFGWYRQGSSVGIIFTEIPPTEGRAIAKVLRAKLKAALYQALGSQQLSLFRLSCYVFPEDWYEHGPGEGTSREEPLHGHGPTGIATLIKACVDVAGSAAGLLLLSPFLLAIGIAVKMTSKGPVFFRQQRIGQYGRPFTFLKFRSMHASNNHAVHQEYVKQFIAGAANCNQAANGNKTTFKLTNDPRITPLGRFLRKTSLDELPQLINVLKGDMSLVGPRPPIPYEVNCYDIWHKRRLLAVKPGITGLWQVNGRSRTTFDEMVRLDLQYGETWSLLLDLKILINTPRAIFSGDGAY
ncbi:MAG TPA: sugar transferase [Terriglobales bacterium]|nr:sugar transferase [Terriglobales bacterium]